MILILLIFVFIELVVKPIEKPIFRYDVPTIRELKYVICRYIFIHCVIVIRYISVRPCRKQKTSDNCSNILYYYKILYQLSLSND